MWPSRSFYQARRSWLKAKIQSLDDMEKSSTCKLTGKGSSNGRGQGGNQISDKKRLIINLYLQWVGLHILRKTNLAEKASGSLVVLASNISASWQNHHLKLLKHSKRLCFPSDLTFRQYGVVQYDIYRTQLIAQPFHFDSLDSLCWLLYQSSSSAGSCTIRSWCLFHNLLFLEGRWNCRWCQAFLLDLISGYPQWMFFSLLFHGGKLFPLASRGKARYLGCFLQRCDGRRLRT